MITLKELRWSNAFSYGADNTINFVNSPLIQLVGKNGHGKSSIALILEEVLFNKNSKGIKKADILNRYLTTSQYNIDLDFEIDGVEYTIKSKRAATQTVKLYCAGNDISAHTATATYKLINELIGIDHKTFTQIVYQSNASSLEFLTATDSNRKKFLIDLLNLSRYSAAADLFKQVSSDISKECAAAQAKIDTVSAWLKKYENIDLQEIELQDVPEIAEELITAKSTLQEQLDKLDSINKKIAQNNKYKELQNKIILKVVPDMPTVSLEDLKVEHATLKKEIEAAQAYIKKVEHLSGSCPTCLQAIDGTLVASIIEENAVKVKTATAKINNIKTEHAAVKQQLEEIDLANKAQQEWEKYHALIDTEMQTEILQEDNVSADLAKVNDSINSIKKAIAAAEAHNKAASAHNAKVSTVSAQLSEFNQELSENLIELGKLTDQLNTVSILTKVFSNNGLVAYKIECLVKDLESLTNEYLVDLSDGRFQLAFKISASDKLNVIITDNGVDIDIAALSNGERARVNVATLLAIRKLMQSLSSSRINLLILDETIESLDTDGKEKLIEILLKEENLNTFLISHGFSHPLLEKVNVVKEQNISRIEV